jgi:hypothetical protein
MCLFRRPLVTMLTCRLDGRLRENERERERERTDQIAMKITFYLRNKHIKEKKTVKVIRKECVTETDGRKRGRSIKKRKASE